MLFQILLCAAAIGYISYSFWVVYRMGYEEGRKFELEREAQRLDKEARRVQAESRRFDEEAAINAAVMQHQPQPMIITLNPSGVKRLTVEGRFGKKE
jgi:hypothetical protein